ncbi:hypothetical protein ILUMI_12956 [Ignelater luminosus]|uniref:Regulatory protein zeste n=1 Tax=Ignelater luminosus TaxID=2038154 RepID=A0A8K0G934_IGNLU|nr:hypothetical protein ILUMI_12956 [Ignelater luminosus]
MPKNRGCNYTEREKQELIDIIAKYKTIIENKKTDSISIKEKQECWNIIAQEYNIIVDRPRGTEQLKGCYNNIKRASKQQVANERSQEYLLASLTGKEAEGIFEDLKAEAKKQVIYDKVEVVRTGGGTFVEKTSDTSAKIIAMGEEQFNPQQNAYDDAASYFKDTDKNFIILDINEGTENGISVENESKATVNDIEKVPNPVPTCSWQVNVSAEIKNSNNRSFKENLTEYTVQRKKNIQQETD